MKMFEDCFVQKVELKVLCTKYNTNEVNIRNILKELGFHQIPRTWSKHPEFPIKSENISLKEYSEAIFKYYKKVANQNCGNPTKKV